MESNIKEIFNDSLDAVGLNFIKYSHMPPNLKRTVLSFDIHKQISEEIKHHNVIDERFYEREIYDFSEEELESHKRIVNACIALVCLGYTEYIKPLISYLDFPEIRWTVKIDYLLHMLVGTPVDHFKVPTLNDKVNWQNEFITRSFYSTLNDLSAIILNDHRERPINYFDYIQNNINTQHILNTSLSLYQSEIKDELECAEFYYVNTYSYLVKKDYLLWLIFMNDSIDAEKAPFIDTITRSVVDVFNDLSIHLDFSFWEEIITHNKIGVLSSTFIYRILNQLYPNVNITDLFLSTFISNKLDANRFQVLYKLSSKEKSILDVCQAYDQLRSENTNVKNRIMKIDPISIYYFKSYLFNLYSSEKESLAFCSQHKKPGSKDLYRSFKNKYNENNEILAKVSLLKDILTTNIDFFEKVSNLNERRIYFKITYLSTDEYQEDIKDIYVTYFSKSINKAIKNNLIHIKNLFFDFSDE